jgi:hypothetical protein
MQVMSMAAVADHRTGRIYSLNSSSALHVVYPQ